MTPHRLVALLITSLGLIVLGCDDSSSTGSMDITQLDTSSDASIPDGETGDVPVSSDGSNDGAAPDTAPDLTAPDGAGPDTAAPDTSASDVVTPSDATPVDTAMPPADMSPQDMSMAECQSACDCGQGQGCENGSCSFTSLGRRCCTDTVCPGGMACDNPDGSAGTCAGGGSCNSTCDCPTGQGCVLGSCQASPVPVYCCDDTANCPPNNACQDSGGNFGVCGSGSNGCNVACDCDQGLGCIQGQCIAGIVPEYCCDKAGCPTGDACTDSMGASGTCP